MPDADNSLPPSGQTLQRAFSSLVEVLNARGVRYAIIGGIATIQHTRVRTTNDIDGSYPSLRLRCRGCLRP